MAQATVRFRMDDELKHDFERLCRDVGMNLTTAFTIFAKQSVRANKISVSLSGDPFYSETTIRELERRAARIEAGLGHEHELVEVDD